MHQHPTADAPYRFRFRCTYRNSCSYTVYGSPETSELEEYSPLGWLEESEHKWYNGTEAEYQADVVARIGGVANRTGNYRLSHPVWQAYVNFLTQNHRESVARIAAHPEKYGDYQVSPLVIPRPIFWDTDRATWSTEPWYTGLAESQASTDAFNREAARRQAEADPEDSPA